MASRSFATVPRGGFVGGGGYVRGGAPAYARSGYGHGGGSVHGGYGYGYSHGYGRVVGPVHYYRPYYAFHPRFSIGFGIWAGYPFAYSLGFYNPFWAYPYGYTYS